LDYGGELDKVGKLGSYAKWAGRLAGYSGIFISGWQLSQAQTLEKQMEYGFDMFMGGFGFVPVVGPPAALYWGTVGKPLHYNWVNRVLIPQHNMGIIGLPYTMPFK